MKKRAVVIVQYQDEKDLNGFLAKNDSYLQVESVYEDLDAADIERLEFFINEEIIEVEED